MTEAKKTYLEETLKRLPLIVICLSGLWFVINKLNTIEKKIEKIELLSFKDKESIDAEIVEAKLIAQNTSNRTTELEKCFIKMEAILNNYKLEIKNEDNR